MKIPSHLEDKSLPKILEYIRKLEQETNSQKQNIVELEIEALVYYNCLKQDGNSINKAKDQINRLRKKYGFEEKLFPENNLNV